MKKYFITGSSKGIGSALTGILLKDENVSITGISRTNKIQHPRFQHISLDLSDIGSLLGKVDEIFESSENYQEITLINNAGYLGEIKYFGDIPDSEYKKIFNINITAVAVLLNGFVRNFKNHPAKKIVINISSGAGKFPYDGWSGYCTSKAAVDMLSQVAALENEKRGKNFRIVSLAPGIIETGMQEQIRSTNANDFSKVGRFHDLKNNNELETPDEAARKIIKFISDIYCHEEVIVDIRN